MKLNFPLFLLLVTFFSFISCTSTRKIVYFENVKDTTFYSGDNEGQSLIAPNDILSISISSLNAEASAIFNPLNNNNARSTTVTGSSSEAGGYLVNADGTLQLPVLGNIKAAGLTKKQLKDNITNLILSKKLLVGPLVEIRFLNYEVTVIGEVARPTVITVPSEKISMLKAIGLAGDLTIFGKRENVLLIREENGNKKTRHIDLTSRNFFNSPYYYLQPNDVVYVEPNKNRVRQGTTNPQLIPVLFGVLSVVIIVLDRVIR
ncbi:MAG TPA: polysaccharide biosynthesis/export family protein [Chitinophagaceae bacterium]